MASQKVTLNRIRVKYIRPQPGSLLVIAETGVT